jgi:luciferase family oxidoreductase group 1
MAAAKLAPISAAMPLLSVLDLAPVAEGSDPGQALRNSRRLAQAAERLGYARYWLAEHHTMTGIASAATAVALAHVAGGTSTIRVGAGGIMLPNHAPLQVAEQFGTLEALYPGRIDLGLGRAPGTDTPAVRALRRTLVGGEERFPQDVAELIAYLAEPQAGQAVVATPGAGTKVPVYILGSSTFGAQLAAYLGLPFAFASHFAPQALEQALLYYRHGFRPSAQLERPYVMLGVQACAAETDAAARYLFSSTEQAFVNLRTGRAGRLPPPKEGYADGLDPTHRAILDGVLSRAVVGGPQTVREGLTRFAEAHGADELIVTTQVFDHDRRVRSFEILAQAMELTPG